MLEILEIQSDSADISFEILQISRSFKHLSKLRYQNTYFGYESDGH